MNDLSPVRTRRLAAVRLGAGILLVTGCFGGSVPARELYRLGVSAEAPASAAAPAGALAGTIEVARYATPGLYGDGNIVFRTGEHEYGVYPSREWGIPLGEMLGMLAEGALARAPLTDGGAIYDPPPGHDLPYVWRGMVREFDEINRNRNVFVAVRLDAQVVRTADDAVLWKGSRRLERAVPEPKMAAIVADLSSLATEVTEALIADARAALLAGATAESSQPPR